MSDYKNEKNPLEVTAHSRAVLAAFAKEAQEAELKKIINTFNGDYVREEGRMHNIKPYIRKPPNIKLVKNKTQNQKLNLKFLS